MRRFALIGLTAFSLAVAACQSSHTPTAPSPTANVGDGSGEGTGAASGLKATAPTIVGPKDGVRLDTLKPTLEWVNSRGTYVTVKFTYEIEFNLGSTLVNTFTADQASGDRTTFNMPDALAYDTVYRWRVRGSYGGAATDWSEYGQFSTPKPPPSPIPTPGLVGKIYFNDLAPGNQWDIFVADLYLVPKQTSSSAQRAASRLPGVVQDRLSMKRGIHRFRAIEIDGQVKEHPVVHAFEATDAIDLSLYDFVLRNKENLTNSSPADDGAVDVNEAGWITWIKDPDGRFNNPYNSQVAYMNLADRVQHQLTPINGQYDGDNLDAAWKDTSTISWSHAQRIVEVNIFNQAPVTQLLPDWNGPQYDPVYSPDGTMLLFSGWIGTKKNGFLKYLKSGTYARVLPSEYFDTYRDDNPTWVFSNTRITGHIFMGGRGRIYVRDLDGGPFSIITDGTRDFEYVTPVQLGALIFLVFTEQSTTPPTLWICDITGGNLRSLNQTGDEPVFALLGLPVPQSKEDRSRVAIEYMERFKVHRPSSE